MTEHGQQTTTGSSKTKHSVLFVCWGNICRSPTAEAIFKRLLEERGVSESWTVDSAGTGDWNLGELPDPRTLKTLRYKVVPLICHIYNDLCTVCRRHGLDSDHRARLLVEKDLEQFEHIIVFDHKNIQDTLEMYPKGLTEDRLTLLGRFDSEQESDIIEDPYYLEDKDFETTYLICERACKAFLESVEYKQS